MSVARRTVAASTGSSPSPTTRSNPSSSTNDDADTSSDDMKPLLKQHCMNDPKSENAVKKNASDKAPPEISRGKTASPRGLYSPRGRAVLAMSLSLAIHLGGYELARAAVMALFTSDGLGFGKGGIGNQTDTENDEDSNDNSQGEVEGGLSALPMAVGFVSPFSVALLWFYAKTLDFGGPAYALRFHTLVCAMTQILAGWILGMLDQLLKTGMVGSSSSLSLVLSSSAGVKLLSQPLLFIIFVFQNAYVQLLYAQHWAFISSVLTPEEGTKVFAPIAGLGSIGSTLAAGLVSVLIERGGLIGLLYMAGVSYVASAVMADLAFGLAKKYGFEPKGSKNEESPAEKSDETSVSKEESKSKNESANSKPSSPTLSCCKKRGLFQQAYALFQRVPVLEALFIEVVVSQCLSSLVNFIYLYKLKATITNDAERAGWSGKFYALINGVSGVFQFFIIPILLKYCKAHRIWLFMPTIMLCCTFYQFATHQSAGLFGASASFFAIKTMEYSLRGAANEMLYVSLDYESRYLGKKVISLIAGKFGKSAMAVALSLTMVMYGKRPDMMWYLLTTAAVFTFLWLLSSVRLHSLINSDFK